MQDLTTQVTNDEMTIPQSFLESMLRQRAAREQRTNNMYLLVAFVLFVAAVLVCLKVF